VFTPIVLKLTGVITWSWWWVLSPLWISGILGVLALCGLLAGLAGIRWVARRQMRTMMDQFVPPDQWHARIVARRSDPDASGGDLGLQDGRGQTP
jgi:hypothetical protein